MFAVLDQICVESAMRVVKGSRAPVLDGARRDLQTANLLRFAPAKLIDLPEFQISQEIAGVMGGDDRNSLVEACQRRPIEVIEMGVRAENQVNRRKLANV